MVCILLLAFCACQSGRSPKQIYQAIAKASQQTPIDTLALYQIAHSLSPAEADSLRTYLHQPTGQEMAALPVLEVLSEYAKPHPQPLLNYLYTHNLHQDSFEHAYRRIIAFQYDHKQDAVPDSLLVQMALRNDAQGYRISESLLLQILEYKYTHLPMQQVLAYVDRLPDATLRQRSISILLKSLQADHRLADIAHWLRTYATQEAYRFLLEEAASHYCQQTPVDCIRWVSQLPHSPARLAAAGKAFEVLGARYPQIGLAWFASGQQNTPLVPVQTPSQQVYQQMGLSTPAHLQHFLIARLTKGLLQNRMKRPIDKALLALAPASLRTLFKTEIVHQALEQDPLTARHYQETL